MKGVLFLLILMVSVGGFSQDKLKIRFKKGIVYVNKVAWAKYDYAAGKTFMSTLTGVEFASINGLKYGTGKYNNTTGDEIMHSYCEVHFLKTEISAFEVDAGIGEICQLMIKSKVLVNDNFILENAIEFKNRYAENVSEKVFLTK